MSHPLPIYKSHHNALPLSKHRWPKKLNRLSEIQKRKILWYTSDITQIEGTNPWQSRQTH
jgi:hypothetical protein